MEELFKAIASTDLNWIANVLSQPNAKQFVNQFDALYHNSLFHATKIVNEDIALNIFNMLLDKGADPYYKEDNKQNVLYYLAKDGKAKIIQKLLQTYKYNLNEVDKYNQTPLYWAARYGRLKAAEILLKYGVNINHLDDYGETCLFFAAAQGHLQMCKFLINRGCQPDHVDNIKKTPLHFAKQNKKLAVIQYLNSLKQQAKKFKQKESKSQVHDKKDKKKKQVIRSQFILAYTNQEGDVQQMKMSQLQQFKNMNDNNAKLFDFMHNPEGLDHIQVRNQKRFIKIANKIINSYLKRQDLFIFHFPVDTITYSDYLIHVHKPMDFSTVKTKLQFNCYENEDDFKADIIQVYDNCIKYNGAESNLGKMATQLKLQFHQTYRKQNSL